MNPFRFHLVANVAGLLIGLLCPPFYFLLKRRFSVALALLVLIVVWRYYPYFFGCILVIGSVIGQIRTDYRYRQVHTVNARKDLLYRFTAHILSLFGIREH